MRLGHLKFCFTSFEMKWKFKCWSSSKCVFQRALTLALMLARAVYQCCWNWTKVHLWTNCSVSLISMQRHPRLGKDGRHWQVCASLNLHCHMRLSFHSSDGPPSHAHTPTAGYWFSIPFSLPRARRLCSVKSPALQPGPGCHVSVLGKALWVEKKAKAQKPKALC